MTEFKTGDRVEVRDYDNTEWWPRIFVAKVDLPHPYVVREEGRDWGMTFAQCRHEIVDDAEMARQEKIAELEQQLAQIKNK